MLNPVTNLRPIWVMSSRRVTFASRPLISSKRTFISGSLHVRYKRTSAIP